MPERLNSGFEFFYPQLVDLKTAETLKSAFLDQAKPQKQLQGGEETKNTVSLSYTENPAGYKDVSRHVKDTICLQADDIAIKFDGFISKKRERKGERNHEFDFIFLYSTHISACAY